MTRTRYPIFRLLALGLTAFLFHSGAYADMRCGTKIVSEGESTYDVLRKCGEPADRQVIPASPGHSGSQKKHAANVENWVYGPQNGAYYRLKFLDGKLVSIGFSR